MHLSWFCLVFCLIKGRKTEREKEKEKEKEKGEKDLIKPGEVPGFLCRIRHASSMLASPDKVTFLMKTSHIFRIEIRGENEN